MIKAKVFIFSLMVSFSLFTITDSGIHFNFKLWVDYPLPLVIIYLLTAFLLFLFEDMRGTETDCIKIEIETLVHNIAKKRQDVYLMEKVLEDKEDFLKILEGENNDIRTK